jgi:septum formation protein
VLGGIVLLGTAAGEGEREERSGVAASEVTFRELDAETLDLYLASGEWRDRAGAYAIQGLGSILIERLEGDFSNVVGLPVPLLLQLAPELLSDQAQD